MKLHTLNSMERIDFNKARASYIAYDVTHKEKKEGLNALRIVIRGYLVHKVLKEADRLFDEGVLSGDKLDEILKEHLLIPYKD